jgi:cell division septal protein FtsQ
MKRPIAFLITSLLIGSAYIFGWSNLFTVEKIVVNSSDKKIVKDVMSKITNAPAVVEVGQPLARVDRRAIANRLRELLWIENVKLERNMLSGELRLTVIPRNPIGRLIPKDSTNVESIGFMDQDLDYFYLPREIVERAMSSGQWRDLPELSIQGSNPQLKADVATILRVLQEKSLLVEGLIAKDQSSISTTLVKEGRRLDISWGSVKDLTLKIEVLERLLELKANKSVKNINLSNPISPIVSK